MSTLLNVKNAKIPVFDGTKENFPVWWIRSQTEDKQVLPNIEGDS
jgi:hypothetical protein